MGEIIQFPSRASRSKNAKAASILLILGKPIPSTVIENHQTGEIHCDLETTAAFSERLAALGLEFGRVRNATELYGLLIFSINVAKDLAFFLEKPNEFNALYGKSDWGRYVFALAMGDLPSAEALLPKFIAPRKASVSA